MSALPVLPENLPSTAHAKLPSTYESAKLALAECNRIDECQDWADRAEALASYAKQAQDHEMRKMADRIQARAVRRCGELLEEIESASQANLKQHRGDGAVPSMTRTQAATEAGLSERQRKTAIRVSRVPDAEFEVAVDSDEPPTVTELARRGTIAKSRNKEAQLPAFRERQANAAIAPAAVPTPSDAARIQNAVFNAYLVLKAADTADLSAARQGLDADQTAQVLEHAEGALSRLRKFAAALRGELP